MRTRMSGGVGGGRRKAIPYPDLGSRGLNQFKDESAARLSAVHILSATCRDQFARLLFPNSFIRRAVQASSGDVAFVESLIPRLPPLVKL